MSTGVLQGKAALVTGATKRIGREIALALADAGVNVAIHHRQSPDDAEELAEGRNLESTRVNHRHCQRGALV